MRDQGDRKGVQKDDATGERDVDIQDRDEQADRQQYVREARHDGAAHPGYFGAGGSAHDHEISQQHNDPDNRSPEEYCKRIGAVGISKGGRGRHETDQNCTEQNEHYAQSLVCRFLGCSHR